MSKNTITAAELLAEIAALPRARSYWGRAVAATAAELVNETADGYNTQELPADPEELETLLLNGADNWSHFSSGGCWHCYDEDIARAFCSPSELKKNRGGILPPNSHETWLEVQARALYQAARIVKDAARAITDRAAATPAA